MAKKALVLIGEDDSFLRKVYSSKLSSEGFSVDLAIDGEDVLAKIKKQRPDIVLLDIIMPKMNGFEVLEEIRNDPDLRSIPVIILSNLGQEGDVERGLQLGAVDFLVKTNLSINQVVDKIRETLSRKEDDHETTEANDKVVCPTCRTKNPAKSKFCNNCGERLISK